MQLEQFNLVCLAVFNNSFFYNQLQPNITDALHQITDKLLSQVKHQEEGKIKLLFKPTAWLGWL